MIHILDIMEKDDTIVKNLLYGLIFTFIIAGAVVSGPAKAFTEFAKLQIVPARLINDFVQIGGIGAALINAAFVGLIGLILILINKVKISGPTFAAVLTLMGFGLFGKTVLNILPIIAGVYLAARYVDNEFKQYIIIALFGTALGPVVSFIAFEFGLTGITGILTGMFLGLITGFILPALAVSMLHLHQGFNLYNMGLTCGFFGLFASAFVLASGHKYEKQLNWYDGDSSFLIWLVPVMSLIFIAIGFIFDKKNAFKAFKNIQKIPGRLPSDFMVMESMEGALINSGLIGLFGSLYVFAVGADFNGPVIGGLLTIMGFAAFGTNLRNSWPVVAGVVIAALLFNFGLAEPGPILAAIFVTTLGPLAGEFGWKTGIFAGFTHMVMVSQTGGWHGGMNLYNNGFAGGLTAALIVAIIQWYKANKPLNSSEF